MSFEELFPVHKCSLTLAHNDHLDYYESVEEFYDKGDFESEEDFKKCVNTNNVWRLHWYPDTPVGFFSICGSSLERLLERAKEIEAQ